MQHLVIIGNGITGVTAARRVRKATDMKITIISGETDHHFSRTALMYIYMGHMKFEHTKPYEDWFWEKNRLELLRATVESVNSKAGNLKLTNGDTLAYDKLLIACGSAPNKFGWPGQDLPGVQGLYSMPDLELMEKNTAGINQAVIVGGGLIGIEVAEMLSSRGISVTFLVREENFWDIILPTEEAKMINRHILEHGIDLRLGTELKEIVAGEDGRAAKIITNFDDEIPCQFVALTVGVHPNIEFLKDSGIQTGRGVLVNDYLETNVENVYAAGDCAEIVTPEDQRNRVEQLWYTGRMQGDAVGCTLSGKRKKYDRGIWFNSAKFFDIEYQTYGFVGNNLQADEESFYWEHPDHKHCLRLVYKRENRALSGVNVFGIRMRQNVCTQWIRERRPVEYVLQHLKDANFDPEFFKRYEADIIAAYNTAHPQQPVTLNKRRKLSSIFA